MEYILLLLLLHKRGKREEALAGYEKNLRLVARSSEAAGVGSGLILTYILILVVHL